MRLLQVTNAFESHFKRPPTGVTCAPGRVNLIGEHVDYEGYAVLPMAIDHSIYVAFNKTVSGSSKTGVMAVNVANAKQQYKSVRISLDEQKCDHGGLTWVSYILCGVLGLRDAWPESFKGEESELQLLVDGDIPAGCGLSSSSALVVAVALATSCALEIPLARSELAELCRQAEHRVGTIGGGMDQAVACLAQRGTALHLDFAKVPARSEPVVVPYETGEVTFVIANSMVVAKKAVDAATRYNKRVVECALAAKLIAKKVNLDAWRQFTRLVDVQIALEEATGEFAFPELIALAITSCPLSEYLLADIEAEVGEPILNLFEGSFMEAAVKEVLKSVSTFKLQQRAQRVWGEADRVKQFVRLCDSLATEDQTDCLLLQKHVHCLGEIMNASHHSCKTLYECSCLELDNLVNAAKSAGAIGARLTGAGWGGCIVALVQKSEVNDFMSKLYLSYYRQLGMSPSDAMDAMFESTPAPGAEIYTYSSPNQFTNLVIREAFPDARPLTAAQHL